jgi:hypothetical protein
LGFAQVGEGASKGGWSFVGLTCLNGADAGLLGADLMSNSDNQIIGTCKDDVTVFAYNFDVEVEAGCFSGASSKLQV